MCAAGRKNRVNLARVGRQGGDAGSAAGIQPAGKTDFMAEMMMGPRRDAGAAAQAAGAAARGAGAAARDAGAAAPVAGADAAAAEGAAEGDSAAKGPA